MMKLMEIGEDLRGDSIQNLGFIHLIYHQDTMILQAITGVHS